MESLKTYISPVHAIRPHTTERFANHMESIISQHEEVWSINNKAAADDTDLLHQIGYKQEMRREFSTLQVFGIALSIMGLVPSITTTAGIGLATGPVGLVWGWFIAGAFILCVGTSLSFLASSIPTSGGLFYYPNYYAGERVRVPLSFLIGCSNTLSLCSAYCSVNYGFASELFATISLEQDSSPTSTRFTEFSLHVSPLSLWCAR